MVKLIDLLQQAKKGVGVDKSIEEKKNHHMMVVGSNIKNKLQEFKYFLEKIIFQCSLVEVNFFNGINPVNSSGENIDFNFSAFVNTVQSLKDGLEYATNSDISWSYFFEGVRHSRFIKECRNAITHDGFSIIDLYTEGKYFVSRDIHRLEKGDKERVIKAPKEDVLTFSIEFAEDLMGKINLIVDDHGANIPKSSNVDKVAELKKRFDNPAIPDFAKKLFEQLSSCCDLETMLLPTSPALEIKNNTEAIIEICRNARHRAVRTPE